MRLVDSYDYGINKKKSPKILELFAVRTGLEPATPCVTGMYSNQAELPHQKFSEPLFLVCECKGTTNF